MSFRKVFLYIICLKIILDFFVPNRDISALLITFFLIFNFKRFNYDKGSVKFIFRVVCFFLFEAILLFFLESDMRALLKFLTYPIYFCFFYLLGKNLSKEDIIYINLITLKVFLICFLVSLSLSLGLNLYFKRIFFNFEHVNLLGSFVLVMTIPLSFLKKYVEKKKIKSITYLLIISAFLTTSTGAFLLSFAILANINSWSFRKIITYVFYVLLFVLFIFFITKNYVGDLHQKIFSPLYVLEKYTLAEFLEFSSKQARIQDLGSDLDSSLTWRLYTWVYFINYIFSGDLFNILFGNGLKSYTVVLDNNKPPHNDFILILIDYGIVFWTIFIFLLRKIYINITKRYESFIPVFFIWILRLLLENTVNSFYITSTIIMFLSVIIGFYSKKNEKIKGFICD